MSGSNRTPLRRPHRRSARLAALAILTAAGLIAAGCSSTSSQPNAVALNPHSVASKPAAPTYFTISPGSGTAGASTTAGITVSAVRGAKLTSVRVKTAGDAVSGSLNAAGTTWHSWWTLDTGESYTVTATGTTKTGHPVSATSSFRTMTPAQTFGTEIFEGAGATYGVGMPIILTFDHPILNKASVEKALELTTSKPVVGAWFWDGDQTVYFRPRDYWPANTAVTLTAHLNGLDAGNGRLGTHTLTQSFNIGESVVAVASTTTHRTQIYVGGQLKYTWPISTGRENMPTPNGTYLTIEKHNPVRMIGGKKGTPGYYNELVGWAVRFTWSGDYYHSAPWSVVNQGVSNVSHGCVNLAPEDAKIYYAMAIPGDPITITGSTKAGKWDNGWTQWFLSWSGLLSGSATGKAVVAGPQGSTLVKPPSVSADPGAVPVTATTAGNYQAA